MEYKPQVPADTRKYTEPAAILDRDAPRFLWGDAEAGYVADWIYGSSDDIHLMSFALTPGQYFVNSNDLKTCYDAWESYYCLEGEFTFLCPETGEVHRMVEGDVLFIPPRTWHYGYNFGTTLCRILETITPPTAEAVEEFSVHQVPPDPELFVDEAVIGSFPGGGEQSNRAILVKPEGRLSEIVGSQNPLRIDLAVATAHLTTGVVGMFPRQRSEEIMHHAGDKVAYVTKGRLNVRVWDSDDWFELGVGDTCFIPKGYRHSFVNYTDEPTAFVFSVAPEYR